jgi:hypothetical protein
MLWRRLGFCGTQIDNKRGLFVGLNGDESSLLSEGRMDDSDLVGSRWQLRFIPDVRLAGV